MTFLNSLLHPVSSNPLFSTPRLLCLAAFTVLTACGGGGGSGGGSSGGAAACDGAVILNNQLEAGDLIELKTNKQLNHIYLITDDGELSLDSSPSAMGYQFAVPITPELATAGGQVQFEAELDGKRCTLPVQTVTPLPAAADDENYTDVLDTLEQALSNFERTFAYDPATVTEEDIQNDPLLLAVHFIHEIFHNPLSEISLPYQRDVFAHLSAADKAFIAQFVEKLDLEVLMADFEAGYDGTPLFAYRSEAAQAAAYQPREPMLTRATCSGNYADNSKHKVDIRDGASLSLGMKLAYAAQQKLDNAQANAAAAATKSTVINTLSTIGSQVKGGALGGPLAIIGTVSGMVALRDSMADGMVASLLPSEITQANLQIIPKPRLEEDYTEKFANPSWLFKVSAKSKEYDISKLVADTGLVVLGAPNSPVDANLMAGLTEVSNNVTAQAKAQDCELIVPPITWPDIPIDTDFAEASFLSGTAFALDATNQRVIKPLAIGNAELEVKLKAQLFPSFTNTLADQRATQVMENLRKSFVFSADPITVKNPGETAEVDVVILNSVSPEKHLLDHSAHLNVTKALSGNTLTLTVDTPADPQRFPQDITLSSSSKSLEPTGDRAKTVEVRLDDLEVRIEETVAGSCQDSLYTEENRAVVTGFANDKSVTWSADGGTLTVLPDNRVRFSTEQLGSYVLTATSNEDGSVSANVTINTLDCNGNTFMSALVISNAQSPSTDASCPVNNPEDIEESTQFGKDVDSYQDLSPATVRSKMSSFSVGRPFHFDQSDSDMLLFSEQRNEQCYTKTLDMVATSKGTVENLGNNTVAFGTQHDTRGYCFITYEEDGSQLTDCVTAGAAGTYEIVWVFDHQKAATYEVINDLVCSARPIPGIPASDNLTFLLLTFDESGQSVNVLPLPQSPLFSTRCVEGVQPVDGGWDVPAMAAGSKVLILGTFINTVLASPPLNGNDPGELTVSNEGDVTGYIQINVN